MTNTNIVSIIYIFDYFYNECRRGSLTIEGPLTTLFQNLNKYQLNANLFLAMCMLCVTINTYSNTDYKIEIM